jgi:hypothetical protein
MTTAATSIDSSTTAPLAGAGIRLRRAPRSPLIATLLLVMWAVFLAAALGIFAWSLSQTGPYDGWNVKGWVVAGALLNWGLLYWRARVLMGLDRRVRAAEGAVCLNCHAPLAAAATNGVCNACGEPFDLAQTRVVWMRHMP